MVLDKWRQRRKSIKELKEKEEELRAEYMRMRERELILKGGRLPAYEEITGGAGAVNQNVRPGFGSQRTSSSSATTTYSSRGSG